MKRKNNVFTTVLLIAVAVLLVMMIVSVLDYSPAIKECSYGEMLRAFTNNEVFGYIQDPNEFSVIVFYTQADWDNYWDGNSKNDEGLYESLTITYLSSSEYYDIR